MLKMVNKPLKNNTILSSSRNIHMIDLLNIYDKVMSSSKGIYFLPSFRSYPRPTEHNARRADVLVIPSINLIQNNV